jgi:hypothetical protein
MTCPCCCLAIGLFSYIGDVTTYYLDALFFLGGGGGAAAAAAAAAAAVQCWQELALWPCCGQAV